LAEPRDPSPSGAAAEGAARLEAERPAAPAVTAPEGAPPPVEEPAAPAEAAPEGAPPAAEQSAVAGAVQQAGKKKRRKRFSVWRFLLLLILGTGGLGGGMVTWGYRQFAADLPQDLSVVHIYRPPRASRVYSADGELIGEFFKQKRIVVPIERVPKHVRQAFVAAEDARFYKHGGVDPIGIVRAAYKNWKAGHVVQGASTITQQVARLMLLDQQRTLQRKIREAILAHRIEKDLTKEEILSIYLNHVYLGHGAYGVQAAAEIYFGKDVQGLSVAEAALLAGLPKAPTSDSPYVSFSRGRARQLYVLDRMLEEGFTTAAQGAAAREEPIALIQRETSRSHVAAPYFAEHVRRYLIKKYGAEELFAHGVDVFTTLDMRAQRAAEAAVLQGLQDLDRKLAYSGPVGHLEGEARERFLAYRRPYYGQAKVTAQDFALPPQTMPPASQPQSGPAEEIVGRLADIDLELPHLALVGSLKKGVEVRVGDLALKLGEVDAARALRWKGEGGVRLQPGDLVAVRLVEDQTRSFRRETVRLPAQGKRKARVVNRRRPVIVVRYRAQLAQPPTVQAALLSVDPHTGHVKAMVGGYDFERSQFNRAVQAKRQIGSAIKPFVYGAAMEKGFTELSILYDAPVAFKTATGMWAPKNYDNEYHGAMTLKMAIAKSINTISAQLTSKVGVDHVIDFMRRVGITSAIPRHISIALGTPDLSLWEVCYAHSTWVTGGLKVKPVFITKVVARDGRTLEDHVHERPKEPVIAPEIAYLVVDLMKGVVQYGTGRGARELGRPAAGKTGTSTGFRDAWFIGYTADLLTGVWIGRDDFKPIAYNTTGGQFALPIWLAYMRAAHHSTPAREFPVPANIYFVRASPQTGQVQAPGTPGSVLVPYRRGTLPTGAVATQGGRPNARHGKDDEGAFDDGTF
jgi:penicillin-binding protein 1A